MKLFIESYLDLVFGMALTVVSLFRTNKLGYFSTFGDFVSNSFWLICIGFIVGLPFFEYQMITYGTKKGLIENRQFHERFGVFYEEYRKESKYALLFGVIFKIRRILIVIILLCLTIMPQM